MDWRKAPAGLNPSLFGYAKAAVASERLEVARAAQQQRILDCLPDRPKFPRLVKRLTPLGTHSV
jgi:hypothetical protein